MYTEIKKYKSWLIFDNEGHDGMPVKQQQQLNLSQTNSMFMSLLSKAFIKDNNMELVYK